jgi:hypothetical protein
MTDSNVDSEKPDTSGQDQSLRGVRRTNHSEPLLWSLNDLARALGVSRRTAERLEATGAIGPVRITLRGGRAVKFLADECQAWIAARCPPRDQWNERNGQEIRRRTRPERGKVRDWRPLVSRLAFEKASPPRRIPAKESPAGVVLNEVTALCRTSQRLATARDASENPSSFTTL